MKIGKLIAGMMALTIFATPLLAQGGMDAPSEAIAKVRTAYLNGLNSKDPQAIANLYAEDGQLMDIDGVLHSGRDAVARALSEASATWGHFVNQPGEVMVSGTIAWEFGHGLQHVKGDDGSTVELKSQYLVVLALEDGTWKIKALSIGTPPGMPGM